MEDELDTEEWCRPHYHKIIKRKTYKETPHNSIALIDRLCTKLIFYNFNKKSKICSKKV